MASEFGESASHSPQNPSCSSNNGNGDAGNFECNICFELAQDPIVTLCGHLFCWPCLYKWLHIHSRSRECPICKALIEEEQLVPLYGRGKSSTDPRSKSIPGVNIPNRPAGQRPETAPPPEPNQFPQNGFGFMGGLGGFAPMATARFGNFTLSAAFGGLIPSLFNLQVHGFPDAAMFGHAAGFPYGFSNSYHSGHAHGYHHHHHHHHHHHRTAQCQQDHYLKMLFLFIIVSSASMRGLTSGSVGPFVLPLRGETWHLTRLGAMGNSRSSTSRHGVGDWQGCVYAPLWCWLIMWVGARVMSK
ncbi:RING finger protein 5-like [Gossypium australe]|uniref:E3 ubiquitin-protein ligase RMA n=1 Tax=Gossypium australe TaxID=47621 RepID=A0A5B6W5C2_9ROSI|nr:RING finger protein 5-like [Gossypium australe]